MMGTINVFAIIGCIFIFPNAVSMDPRSSWGKEFILAVMENHLPVQETIMYVATEKDAKINVLAPAVNMNKTSYIGSGLQKVSLNTSLRNYGTGLKRNGIYVTADGPISIYVIDAYNAISVEGYLALPMSTISKEYVIGSDYALPTVSEFVIAAPESNTSVSITFKTNGSLDINGMRYLSGGKYNLEMSALDTLQIQHTYDLTGTMIHSNKPIAVFAGNKCGFGITCNYEIEQMVPIDALGLEYITVPLYPANTYRYRIISPHNNNVVSVQGNNFTLESGDFIERIRTLPDYIHSSKPVMIIEYGTDISLSSADPSMIIIPPISNYSVNYTFSTLTVPGLSNLNDFISVIINKDDADGLMLDNTKFHYITNETVTSHNGKQYNVLVARVGKGSHTLCHSNKIVRYGAIYYGRDFSTNYGFPLGFMKGIDEVESNPTNYLKASCSAGGWNVSVNITLLQKAYPNSSPSSIILGDNSCTGNLIGDTLLFFYVLSACSTEKIETMNSLRYSNSLFYAFHDPDHPFVIRGYNWTIDLVCDLDNSGSLTAGISHSIQHGQNSQLNIRNHYNLNISFFSDPNFMYELPGSPLQVNVGTDVYVKVFTDASDWDIKMRLHTCYVKPYKNSSDVQLFYLLHNGCEVDVNTHIISQSTHETRFVFRDFELSANHNGLHLFCEANFCPATNYTPHCQQVCTPGNTRRIRRNTNMQHAQVRKEIIFKH